MSGSASLRAITVTSALQFASFHRLKSSTFFTSQQSTSSSAPTIALPAFDDRSVAFWGSSSWHQMALDEADVMSPKVFECSYFLHWSAEPDRVFELKVHALTDMI